jgi:hypothetical protein
MQNRDFLYTKVCTYNLKDVHYSNIKFKKAKSLLCFNLLVGHEHVLLIAYTQSYGSIMYYHQN